MRNSRQENFGAIMGILVVITAVVGLFFTPYFERSAPIIKTQDIMYWNGQTPLTIALNDDKGLRRSSLSLVTSEGEKELAKFDYEDRANNQKLTLTSQIFPMVAPAFDIIIRTHDTSLWNFFRGNQTAKKVHIIIDRTAPLVELLSHSYSIARGGSALVVFAAKDNNKFAELSIKTSGGQKFWATPFGKVGYYAALIAWPLDVSNSDFTVAIEARDDAGNKTVVPINYFKIDRIYKDSHIALNDTFLNGKITQVASQYQKEGLVPLERFKFVNETLRKSNEQKIVELTTQQPKTLINDFSIVPFYPLKNGAVVAHYGDHRFFSYNAQSVSESWHNGIDLASLQQSPIISNNAGRVLFASDNGIFGTVPVIEHGLGLYTIYGHCDQSLVKVGDTVHAGQIIAKSGTTGLALGDHLHFGTVVQGVDVTPIEWMDAHWIKVSITDVLTKAKQLIVGRP